VFEVKSINETSIEYVFGASIDKETNQKVLQVYPSLKDENIIDLVPTYTSLALHFTPQCALFSDIHAFDETVKKALDQEYKPTSKEHIIYVDYKGEDFAYLCQVFKLTKEELIRIHTQNTYTLAMLGFREYFPYLLGLDERLNLPRRESPRTLIKKGAVAIAAGQCGIYSQDSPGGWHILGYTDFDGFKDLHPCDTLIFRSKNVN